MESHQFYILVYLKFLRNCKKKLSRTLGTGSDYSDWAEPKLTKFMDFEKVLPDLLNSRLVPKFMTSVSFFWIVA